MRTLLWSDDLAATVAALRDFAPPAMGVRAIVGAIVEDVRERGDEAVRAHTAFLDRVDLPRDYAVPVGERRRALAELAPALREALELAAANIREYHRRETSTPWRAMFPQGQAVGQEVVPLAVAGLYVPGGLANYPSSVLMTAIPAQVAGVGRIVACSPPRQDGCAAAGVAAACQLLGVDDLYPIGGAQAVAAMAYGTATVPRCDVIVGPGNAYVTEAKRQVMGEVGIDGLAGPSEVLVVADETASPEWLAADLLAQAEHGAGSMACLADIGGNARRGRRSGGRQAWFRARDRGRERCRRGLPRSKCRRGALQRLRPRASGTARRRRRGTGACDPQRRSCPCGTIAATAFADYAAGGNHVPPTGGSARFAQGLSVAAFQKRVAVVELDRAAAAALAAHVATIADEEGLRAHARSARLRLHEE